MVIQYQLPEQIFLSLIEFPASFALSFVREECSRMEKNKVRCGNAKNNE